MTSNEPENSSKSIEEWAQIGRPCQKERMETLSRVLEQHGCANRVHFFEPEAGEFEECMMQARQKVAHIRVTSPFRELDPEKEAHLSSDLLFLRSAEYFFRDRETWWPRNNWPKVIQRVISRAGDRVDLHGAALIIGAGGLARSFIMAFARMGIRRITILGFDDARAEKLIEECKRALFGVDLMLARKSWVTQLPGIHSLIAMCASRNELNDPDLMRELSFFNFLKPPGIYLDIRGAQGNELLQAADRLGAKTISGETLKAALDTDWVAQTLGPKIDESKLVEEYRQLDPNAL